MYGVPDFPDIDVNEMMTEADIDTMVSAAENDSTAAAIAQASTSAATSATSAREPCAVISSAMAAMPAGARTVIPAELGVQCLRSVPLDKEGDMRLIDDLKLYAKWQSNIAYLKDPPAGYNEQPIDIMGELDRMKNELASDGFSSEYEFQLQLMSLVDRAYDNHFAYQPDILASAMQFQRPPGTELVSVSTDGIAVPEIFAYRDIVRASNDTSFTPSAVRMIDGMTAQNYLANASEAGDFHDADVRWNAMFPSQALIASGTTFLGAFRTGMYTGQPNTTLQFANGTVFSMVNLAVVTGNFSGVNNGQDFFRKFCSGPQPVPQAPSQAPGQPGTPTNGSQSARPAPSHIGYPKAVMINPSLAVGGYYLEGAGYEVSRIAAPEDKANKNKDIAILSIPSYSAGPGGSGVQGFQNTMRDFIRKSKTDGKTKMIFDLRGNGGGNAILGYDTFKQVYPQAEQEPFGGTRYRANDALNQAGKITQNFLARKTFVQSNKTIFTEAFGQGVTEDDIFGLTTPFNYQHTLDANNKAFRSWEQLFGPDEYNNDTFTTTLRYNYSDSVSTTYDGFSVIGFGANLNETTTPQPFQAQDMVMLNDGMCSSTCAIVAELLKNQGGVRTIAVGGRPQPGPMQGVGGTKGAQVFSWDDIQVRMQAAFFLGSPAQRAQWNKTDLGRTAFATQLFTRSAYRGGQVAGGVNLKDNLRQGDASKMPLEFMYEAADCRMFFTAPMISDVTQVWKGVVDRMFQTDGSAMCVEGSTMDKTSVSGGGQFMGGDGKINPIASAATGPGTSGNRSPAQFAGVAAGRAEERVWWLGTVVVMGVVAFM